MTYPQVNEPMPIVVVKQETGLRAFSRNQAAYSVAVGIEPPPGREKTGALIIRQSAACVLVMTDDE
jgi:hypothetical protein